MANLSSALSIQGLRGILQDVTCNRAAEDVPIHTRIPEVNAAEYARIVYFQHGLGEAEKGSPHARSFSESIENDVAFPK